MDKTQCGTSKDYAGKFTKIDKNKQEIKWFERSLCHAIFKPFLGLMARGQEMILKHTVLGMQVTGPENVVSGLWKVYVGFEMVHDI